MLGLSLEHGFLLAWSMLLLVIGLPYALAPERTLRSSYRWNDLGWRWITFGRLQRAPGPKLMRDETAVRVMRWVGLVAAVAGATTLVWLAVDLSD
jgi:hypothetical protein